MRPRPTPPAPLPRRPATHWTPELDVSLTSSRAHDDAIDKVIRILQAQHVHVPRVLANDVHGHRKYAVCDDTSRVMDAYNDRLGQRHQIAGASAEYRAAVTSLVIEGSLNIDDGRDLLAIVEGILREHGMT